MQRFRTAAIGISIVCGLLFTSCTNPAPLADIQPDIRASEISGTIELTNADQYPAYFGYSSFFQSNVVFTDTFSGDGAFNLNLTAPTNFIGYHEVCDVGPPVDISLINGVFTSDEPLPTGSGSPSVTIWFATIPGSDENGDYIVSWLYVSRNARVALDPIGCSGPTHLFEQGWSTVRYYGGYRSAMAPHEPSGTWVTQTMEFP